MRFDFTPDPKVLIALTHTPMQPLDPRLKRSAVQNSFFAVSLTKVTPSDIKAMETAMTACLVDLTSEPIWSVDKLFECARLSDVGEVIDQLLRLR